jgi:hypothetical protein
VAIGDRWLSSDRLCFLRQPFDFWFKRACRVSVISATTVLALYNIKTISKQINRLQIKGPFIVSAILIPSELTYHAIRTITQ